MKCEEAQGFVTEYLDHQLPEVTRRRIDHHLAKCSACRSEYAIWQESNEWIQADKYHYSSIAAPHSFVDAVMARILSEEKWAIPIGKKVFTLTARMRILSVSAAAVLLMLFSFSLFNQTNQNDFSNNALIPSGESLAMVASNKAQVVSASLQTDDGTYVVQPEPAPKSSEPLNEIETASSSVFSLQDGSEPMKTNYGIILSIFGILITVLSVSWLSRV